jgi:hypothetical protein
MDKQLILAAMEKLLENHRVLQNKQKHNHQFNPIVAE